MRWMSIGFLNFLKPKLRYKEKFKHLLLMQKGVFCAELERLVIIKKATLVK